MGEDCNTNWSPHWSCNLSINLLGRRLYSCIAQITSPSSDVSPVSFFVSSGDVGFSRIFLILLKTNLKHRDDLKKRKLLKVFITQGASLFTSVNTNSSHRDNQISERDNWMSEQGLISSGPWLGRPAFPTWWSLLCSGGQQRCLHSVWTVTLTKERERERETSCLVRFGPCFLFLPNALYSRKNDPRGGLFFHESDTHLLSAGGIGQFEKRRW